MVMGAGSFLTEDILVLIFTYLPLTSICKFKAVSKVLLSILSNPYFLTRWFQFNNANKSLPWIHYRSSVSYNGEVMNLRLKEACPSLHSQFISTHDHGFSFRFLINTIMMEPFQGQVIEFVGSSHGLVLCYTTDLYRKKRCYVCNPLTQKLVSIPSPPKDFPWMVIGLSCDLSSSFYKVACIRSNSCKKYYYADIFCSNVGEWRTFQVSRPVDVSSYYECDSCENVVTQDGVLYWIANGHDMIACNLNNLGTVGYQCSCISLPDKYGARYGDCILGEAEGLICYARITRSTQSLSVWKLKEDNWQMLCDGVELHDIVLAIDLRKPSMAMRESAELVQVGGFNPLNSHVVFLSCWDYIWEFNIRTRIFEELCCPSIFPTNKTSDDIPLAQPFVLKPIPTVLPPPSWIDT